MLIEFSEVVRGVPKRRVFEWLTDYQSFDPQVSRVRLREATLSNVRAMEKNLA